MINIDKPIRNKISDYLKQKDDVFACYIFGSFADGNQNKSSDLDIALIVPDAQKINYSVLFFDLSRIITDYDIDLRIIRKDSGPMILFQILKNGILLYEKDRKQRIVYEAKALSCFYDTQYIRDIFNLYLERSIKEGTYAHR
jgi:uncharacterized protein